MGASCTRRFALIRILKYKTQSEGCVLYLQISPHLNRTFEHRKAEIWDAFCTCRFALNRTLMPLKLISLPAYGAIPDSTNEIQ